jgi:quercetin dioxygenase-like cupin family protein
VVDREQAGRQGKAGQGNGRPGRRGVRAGSFMAAADLRGEDNMGREKMGDGTGYPAGRRARIADLVEYREGSVVSRILAKKESGSVTLFAFDRGQDLSEHTAPFDALVHVLDGEARFEIAGQRHQLQAGEMILLPANEPHSVSATERFKMVLIMLRG